MGTAVIVLLLVIFLPMLLEEEPANPVPDSDLAIPPRPEPEARLDPELTDPPAETFAFPETPEPPATAEQAEAPERSMTPELPPPDTYRQPAAVSEPGVEPVQAAEPASVPETTPAPQPDRVEATSTPDANEPEQVRRPPETGPAWVVQVSSLTEKPRALSLQRELIAKGFPAFVEQAKVGGKTYHRVRVGPRTERKDIEAMASSLRDKAGYEGQILRYP